jgi:hypothetical protein
VVGAGPFEEPHVVRPTLLEIERDGGRVGAPGQVPVVEQQLHVGLVLHARELQDPFISDGQGRDGSELCRSTLGIKFGNQPQLSDQLALESVLHLLAGLLQAALRLLGSA